MAKCSLPVLLLSFARAAVCWETWCAWVPIPMQHEVEGCTDYRGENYISDAGSEGCASWCTWVPVLAWHYADDCAFCGKVVPEAAKGKAKGEAKGKAEAAEDPQAAREGHGAVAAWCKWVPRGALKYVRKCQGMELQKLSVTAGCERWCEWVPEPAWQHPEGCRRCDD
eukprot:Skav220411  [mRNA]  locus=scaffold639:476815:477318:- [translate_table: standard]